MDCLVVSQGLYEKALEDSEKALGLDGESIRALFRKARALNELGRHKEAYECSSRCSLALPHVSAVSQASVLRPPPSLPPPTPPRPMRPRPSVPRLPPLPREVWDPDAVLTGEPGRCKETLSALKLPSLIPSTARKYVNTRNSLALWAVPIIPGAQGLLEQHKEFPILEIIWKKIKKKFNSFASPKIKGKTKQPCGSQNVT